MVFPHNEAVVNATHKKRKRTSSTKAGVTKRKGTSTSTSTSTADTRSTRCYLKLFSVSLLYHVQSPHQYTFFCFLHKIWNWIQWPSSSPSFATRASSSRHRVPWSHRTYSADTKEEVCHQEKTYTKEGSCSCGRQPVQPRFKYQKQEATPAWIKCDSKVLFWLQHLFVMKHQFLLAWLYLWSGELFFVVVIFHAMFM